MRQSVRFYLSMTAASSARSCTNKSSQRKIPYKLSSQQRHCNISVQQTCVYHFGSMLLCSCSFFFLHSLVTDAHGKTSTQVQRHWARTRIRLSRSVTETVMQKSRWNTIRTKTVTFAKHKFFCSGNLVFIHKPLLLGAKSVIENNAARSASSKFLPRSYGQFRAIAASSH